MNGWINGWIPSVEPRVAFAPPIAEAVPVWDGSGETGFVNVGLVLMAHELCPRAYDVHPRCESERARVDEPSLMRLAIRRSRGR